MNRVENKKKEKERIEEGKYKKSVCIKDRKDLEQR